ncbi:MAG: hypothetical protein QM778_28660 [Myxococcales bacterium]
MSLAALSSPPLPESLFFPTLRRAVVVGAGVVGMAVARVLSERFDQVVLVERDHLNHEQPEHRRGVQQSVHIHNLMRRGQEELEGLFPGFHDVAVLLGATQIDHGRDVARCSDVGFCPLFETGFRSLSATRALLEYAQRERLRVLTRNVIWLEGTRALGLIAKRAGDALHVIGVRTDHAAAHEIRAALVVDCSGRSFLWKRWFNELGVESPKETVVDSQCGYASRFYRPREPVQGGCTAMMVDPLYPVRPQWGVIVPVEHGRWLVTLGGFNGMYPPSEEAEFERFGERLQTPLFSAWLSQAEPISPVRTFRRLEMRWNHFEDQKRPLAGFLAVGDSAWAHNPLYGQGMSIGVTCARILGDVLREDASIDELGQRYYRAARRFAHPPWQACSLLDFAWPKTEGARPWYAGLARRIGHTTLRAAQFDREVYLAMLRGAHLDASPAEVLTPRVLYGLARYQLGRAMGSLPPTHLDRLPTPEPRA